MLAGKGSLRRANPTRALAGYAPFRPDHYAMGGSGGNTGRSFATAKEQNAGATRVLDRVAPYQFSVGLDAWSITIISSGALRLSNLNPNCSRNAVSHKSA